MHPKDPILPIVSSNDAPQSLSTDIPGDKNPAISSVDELKISADRLKIELSNDDGACLDSLSDDVLLNILLYCGPTDIEESLKLVNRRFHNATSLSNILWKEFCILTGKAEDAQFANSGSLTDFGSLSSRAISEEEKVGIKCTDDDVSNYKRYYFRNPCVPIDFPSIQEALKYCPRTPSKSMQLLGDKATFYSNVGTVVLMPGVYDEQICIGGETWTVDETSSKAVSIRAAFPTYGATILSRKETGDHDKNQPCISISTCDNDTLEGVQKGISVRLSHLRILHSSPGADIWGGNTAINVDGPRNEVVVESCVLQSDSGRGIVVTNQSIIELYRTSIMDCAATGFYLGDWGSCARISGCNIVRNGFGSKRLLSPSVDDEAGTILDRIAAHTRMAEQGLTIPREEFEAVPPGHSGVYVESSMCWINDSLLAGNCLTGLSVVRGGFVSLSASDITENGSTPILIEDAHDVRDATRLQVISIRGGVVEGPMENNFTSLKSNGKKKLLLHKGGVIRKGASIFREALEGYNAFGVGHIPEVTAEEEKMRQL